MYGFLLHSTAGSPNKAAGRARIMIWLLLRMRKKSKYLSRSCFFPFKNREAQNIKWICDTWIFVHSTWCADHQPVCNSCVCAGFERSVQRITMVHMLHAETWAVSRVGLTEVTQRLSIRWWAHIEISPLLSLMNWEISSLSFVALTSVGGMNNESCAMCVGMVGKG